MDFPIRVVVQRASTLCVEKDGVANSADELLEFIGDYLEPYGVAMRTVEGYAAVYVEVLIYDDWIEQGGS